jgi:hypothetical protein
VTPSRYLEPVSVLILGMTLDALAELELHCSRTFGDAAPPPLPSSYFANENVQYGFMCVRMRLLESVKLSLRTFAHFRRRVGLCSLVDIEIIR